MTTTARAGKVASGAQITPALSTGWAVGLPLLRIGLVAVASVITWAIVQLIEPGIAFPPPSLLASLAMLPVNLICLFLLAGCLSGPAVRSGNSSASTGAGC